MALRFLIVGSGFSGAVLAHQLAKSLECSIEIWEERSHLAGNCHTKRDEATGVMVHEYGPHIFNTDKQHIWDYVNSFVPLKPYVHHVKARSGNAIYPLPVNLHTINQFFNQSFSPLQARHFLDGLADKSIVDPQNFEEQALRFIGEDLYKAFFYGYTKKQWGCEPAELPAAILKRIPVRFNYDDNYHPHPFTGIPVDGYTAIIEKMIAHFAIKVFLGRKFNPGEDAEAFDHVFYTGPIDAYFKYQYGRLGYRTVTFEKGYAPGDFQGAAQINYCDEQVPYTRITEYRHFTPWEKHEGSVYFKEYSKETAPGEMPYYPKRLQSDKEMLQQYRGIAAQQQQVSFLGRLATYRYMDMHHVIGEAIDFASAFSTAMHRGIPPPVFPNIEL